MDGGQKGNEEPVKKDRTTIRLGIGLGELMFGTTRDEAKRYLGAPEEIVENTYGGNENDRTEAWYYWQDEISAHFDSDDGYRLGNLITHDKNCVLNGRRLIGKKKAQVLDELRQMGFGEPEIEDMSSQEKPEFELATYESLSLYLWFDHGLLESIQWGYLFEDDRESPVWPDAATQPFDEILKGRLGRAQAGG